MEILNFIMQRPIEAIAVLVLGLVTGFSFAYQWVRRWMEFRIERSEWKLEAKTEDLADAEETNLEIQKEIVELQEKIGRLVQEIASLNESQGGRVPSIPVPTPPAKVVSLKGGRVFDEHYPTAVIRWMGKQGWNFNDTQRVMNKAGFTPADNTIIAQLASGRNGRSYLAPLTEEQTKQLAAWKAD